MSVGWNVPSIDADIGPSASVVVVFLTRVSAAEREALLASINDTEEDGTPSSSAAQTRSLAHVPWLRSTEPDTGHAIFDMMGDQPQGYAVFIDGQTMRERAAAAAVGGLGTVVVVSSGLKVGAAEGGTSSTDGLTAARVGIRRAKSIMSRLLDSKLALGVPDVVPDYAACKLDFSRHQARASEEAPRSRDKAALSAGDNPDYVYVLPAHLPADLELVYEEPTLVSLVHLEGSEVEQLKKAILDGAASSPHADGKPLIPENIRILNWPSDREAGTWSDMYRIFRAIRPPFAEGIFERFALFIDKTEYDDPSPGEIQLLLVQQSQDRFPRRPDLNLQVAKLNQIGSTLRTWRAMFEPPNLNTYSVRGRSARFGKDELSWMRNVSDPDRVILSERDYCLVFLLCPISKARLQKIREELGRDWEVQFYDVSHHVTTPDLRGLVNLLESTEFRKYSDAPFQFLAIDQTTLDDSDGCIVVEASIRYFEDARGSFIGQDHVGFGWARRDFEMAMGMWVNYSVANMSLEEDVGDEIQYVYWSDILEDEVHKLDFLDEGQGEDVDNKEIEEE